jgi:hypothetical protein
LVNAVKNNSHSNAAERWLTEVRGFNSPSVFIGSGFLGLKKEDIDSFDIQHQGFVKQRLITGQQLIVPLRSPYSVEVQNLFFRTMSDMGKNEKSRLLPNCGGWGQKDSGPRTFGFPNLIHDFSKIILCEGMADYFAAECLLNSDGNFLPIGVANASAFINWAEWFIANKYKGTVIILYQIDRDNHGKVSPNGIGQTKAIEALKIFRNHNFNVQLFDWHRFLAVFKQSFNLAQVFDLADVCKLARECSVQFEILSNSFISTIIQREENSDA